MRQGLTDETPEGHDDRSGSLQENFDLVKLCFFARVGRRATKPDPDRSPRDGVHFTVANNIS
jgi:hypothetical protein